MAIPFGYISRPCHTENVPSQIYTSIMRVSDYIYWIFISNCLHIVSHFIPVSMCKYHFTDVLFLIHCCPGAHFTNVFSIEIHIWWKFTIYSVFDSDTAITTKFCTWHDSCAVLACGKICCELVANYRITGKWSFHRIWILSKKIVSEMSPCPPTCCKQQVSLPASPSRTWHWNNRVSQMKVCCKIYSSTLVFFFVNLIQFILAIIRWCWDRFMCIFIWDSVSLQRNQGSFWSVFFMRDYPNKLHGYSRTRGHYWIKQRVLESIWCHWDLSHWKIDGLLWFPENIFEIDFNKRNLLILMKEL